MPAGDVLPSDAAPIGDGLWAGVEALLDQEAAAPQTRTTPPDAGVWEAFVTGVERKVLHLDAASGRMSYFVRMKAGAQMPAHRHAADEHCVVLSGELSIGGVAFGAGAFHFASHGVVHGRITAVTDAVFFIHGGV